MSGDAPPAPYKGLRPYGEADAALFFARDREIRLLIASLFAVPLTLCYGPAGVGKSSLLYAGVVSRLRQRDDVAVASVSEWHGDVAGLLEERLARATGSGFDTDGLETLGDYCAACFERTRRLPMLVLDQFEEHFLYNRPGDAFDAELARTVTQRRAPVSVVIGIREDALAKLDLFEGRIPGLFDNYLRIDYLDREGARAAIEKPLDEYGARVEVELRAEAPLVAAVLDAAQRPGDEGRFEPVLVQLLMEKVWATEQRRDSRVLRHATLEELGGFRNVVRAYVDEALGELAPGEQEQLADLFHHLVTPSGGKMSHTARDLATWAGLRLADVEPLLERLSRSGRILRRVEPARGQRRGVVRYEIFHDALAEPVLDWRGAIVKARDQRRVSELVTTSGSVAATARHLPLRRAERTGLALCLSGAGFRSALFHLGALRRLNELGVLSKVDTFSSTSGGSIVAALLARVSDWPPPGSPIPRWEETVAGPLRALVQQDLRTSVPRSLARLASRLRRPAEALAAEYMRFFPERLTDLPQRPRFVFGAADLTFLDYWAFDTGARRAGDSSAGFMKLPDWPLAVVLAASTASSARGALRLGSRPWELEGGTYQEADRDELVAAIELGDGEILDAMALEPVWRDHTALLASSGGMPTAPSHAAVRGRSGDALRYTAAVVSQSYRMRRRWLLSSFVVGELEGTYWAIDGSAWSYPEVANALAYSRVIVRDWIGRIRGGMGVFSQPEVAVLENHGYLLADVAIRAHADWLLERDAPSASVPWPEWMDEAHVWDALIYSHRE